MTCQAFRGTLAAKVVICPGDYEAEGLVERGNGYLETSFLPGAPSPTPRTSNRAHRLAAEGERPDDAGAGLLAGRADQGRLTAMLTLPPLAPVTGWRQSLRLWEGLCGGFAGLV